MLGKMKKLLFSVFVAFMLPVMICSSGSNTVSNTIYFRKSANTANYTEHTDFSGTGTVINGRVTNEAATVVGDQLSVPIYKAAYVPNNDWNWFWNWGWSDWSTSNNPYNDYNSYRGNTATEYQVESRQEYIYTRIETVDVCETSYHAKFRGNQWWNWFVTFTLDSWYGYYGSIDNYSVEKRWTTQEKHGTCNQRVYTGWCTSAPVSFLGENSWTVSQTRTTYRYRSLNMNWSETAQKTAETIPLNYSLLDLSGSHIGYGIKLTSNYGISEHCESFFGNYDVPVGETYYVLSIQAILDDIKTKFLQVAAEEKIDDNIFSGIEWTVEGIGLLIDALAEKFAENVFLKFLGKAFFWFDVVALGFSGLDFFAQQVKAKNYKKLIDVFSKAGDYNYICFKYDSCSGYENSIPSYHLVANLYDKIYDLDDDLFYVSMAFKNNTFTNDMESYFNKLGINYYGKVSYVKDTKDLMDNIETYFESYDIFDVASWFGL